eukprot:25716_1
MASPAQQQVVVVQQPQAQQKVVYVNQFGQPIQPQQVVVQQTVPQTATVPIQHNKQWNYKWVPMHMLKYHLMHHHRIMVPCATHSNQYENPQANETEHAYIYDNPP